MIKVLNPGLYTTIQDIGRFGYRNQGVPISGSMDTISANLANSLVKNSISDAVLEITLIGPKLLFYTKTIIAITGADVSPKINNEPISINEPIEVFEGDILSFGKLINGVRSYLALKNGINSELILNSRSQFSNISSNDKLKKNETLKICSNSNKFKFNNNFDETKKRFFNTDRIEITSGPEIDLFSKEEIENILNQKFTISKDNNRMGYQMEETTIMHNNSIITSPVLPGTIQLLPSGKIIILMKDAQTTGGYPRIFQLTDFSISILAQKKTGDKIQFQLKIKKL